MKASKKYYQQILDANLNRTNEGIRVLEEIARFYFQHEKLSRELKKIRHMISKTFRENFYKISIVLSREVKSDPGKDFTLKSELCRNTLISIIRSNAGRIKESLRVFEEFIKLINKKGSDDFKKIRFRFYELEKELEILLLDKRNALHHPQLYLIVDLAYCKNMESTIKMINREKLRLIQIRAKNHTTKEFVKAARLLRKKLHKDTILIINDRVDVALVSNADGVHLGQNDLNLKDAREVMGEEKIIGISVNNEAQQKKAINAGADYLGFGPMYKTSTKKDAGKIKTLRNLNKFSRTSPIPIAPIGGIKPENTEELLKNGGKLIAVISAIFSNKSPSAEIKKFNRIIKIATNRKVV